MPELKTPETLRAELDAFTAGLDVLSKEHGAALRELQGLEEVYDSELEAFVTRLWAQYKDGEIRQWPGEDVRVSLFHEELRTTQGGMATLARITALRARRKRILARLEDVRAGVSARQTLLNAARDGGGS